MKYAQFTTIEEYNAVNIAIAEWKDQQTNGEYSRTDTSYEYTPEPEAINNNYYMPAKPEQVEAGLFYGVVLLDATPEEEQPTMEWLKIDIQNWLTEHSIAFTLSMSKTELLELIP